MERFRLLMVLKVCFLLAATQVDAGCWDSIDPIDYARRCPIIVTGEIASIDVAKVPAKRSAVHRRDKRVYDVAHIKVLKVHKAGLSDVKVKVGGEVLARMNSRQDPTDISTDLSYPVGTKRIWMVYLAGDGEFYINQRPEQVQSLKNELALRRTGAFRLDRERRVAKGVAVDRYSKAEWTQQTKQDEEDKERQRADYRKKSAVARQLASSCFRDGEPLEAGLQALLQTTPQQREYVLPKLRHHGALPAQNREALAEFLMKNDPNRRVRFRAMQYLKSTARRSGVERVYYMQGLSSDDPETRARACRVIRDEQNADLLPRVRALLSDKDSIVRSSAIIALGQVRDEQSLDGITRRLAHEEDRASAILALANFNGDQAVQPLVEMLKSDDPQVVVRAVESLGKIGDKRALPAVATTYRRLAPEGWNAGAFARTFLALGDAKLSIAAAKVGLASPHSSGRLHALRVLALHDSPEVVPLLMAHLVDDFRAALPQRDPDARWRFRLIREQLDKLTGKGLGEDLEQWAQWWKTVHKEYQAPDLAISADEAATLMKEWREIRAAKF